MTPCHHADEREGDRIEPSHDPHSLLASICDMPPLDLGGLFGHFFAVYEGDQAYISVQNGAAGNACLTLKPYQLTLSCTHVMSLEEAHVATDRGIAAIFGSAAGDALAIPYAASPELLAKVPAGEPLKLTSSGEWLEGEWASSTAMSIPVLEAISEDLDMSSKGLDYVANRWLEWQQRSGKGVDRRLTDLFGATQSKMTFHRDFPLGPTMTRCAHEQNNVKELSPANINRAPARMTPLALAYLAKGQEAALVDVASKLTDMTQDDQDAREASALIALGIRNAILTGELGLKTMVNFLPSERKFAWTQYITQAERATPETFKDKNHTAIGAFQAAVAANEGAMDVNSVIDKAVRGGGQSDRVAAIAGAWAGARFGGAGLPEWHRRLHGWPCPVEDLAGLVIALMQRYQS